MQGTFAGWFSKQATDHLNSSALIFLTLGIQRSCVKTWLLLKAQSKITECLGQELILVVKTTAYFKGCKI